MSPRYLRSLIVLISFVASLTAAGPAQAGPPLLCHPFDIGDARSLPWDGSTGWSRGRTDYALDRLVRDTEAMLGPSTPVIVRMETLRRAAIYASRDRKVAALLLERLSSRAHAAEQMARPDPLPLLDAAYLTEAFEGGQEDVVDDVVDIPVRDARQDEPVNDPDMAFVQLPECRPVARLGGGHERAVRHGSTGCRGSHSQSLFDSRTGVKAREGLHGGRTVRAA